MRLFAFGLGYCAARVISRGKLGAAAGTVRAPAALATWRERGVDAVLFEDGDGVKAALAPADVALVSIPPDAAGDPALRLYKDALRGVGRLVYLSTVGVYGDSGGAWVDETSPLQAITPRARARVAAEAAWRGLGPEVDVLRLGGIYGPGRGAFDRLRDGTARRVVKPGQVFNRIHVDDIAGVLRRLIEVGGPGGLWNVADREPAPPQDVISFAAELLGLPPPPEEPFETADLSPMARSFYSDNRRISTQKLANVLGYVWRYPSYREALRDMAADTPRLEA